MCVFVVVFVDVFATISADVVVIVIFERAPCHVPWWISCHNMSSDKFAYHAAPPASFYAYHLFAASSFGCRWVMPVNWQRPDLDQKEKVGQNSPVVVASRRIGSRLRTPILCCSSYCFLPLVPDPD